MQEPEDDSKFVYWKLLLLPFMAYLFVFLLIVLDELIIKTNWISKYINPNRQYGDLFRTIYFPLIYLVRQML